MAEAPADETAATHPVGIRVNGEAVGVRVPADRMLVDVLRYDLGLTGTKEGCGGGVCGACSVLVDGDLRASCLTLAVLVDGSDVRTVEGLADGSALSAVQQAFVTHGALQCGFCTPGQIVAATALLAETPAPELTDVREWMDGNLCRCTGYYAIIEAILAAAGEST